MFLTTFCHQNWPAGPTQLENSRHSLGGIVATGLQKGAVSTHCDKPAPLESDNGLVARCEIEYIY